MNHPPALFRELTRTDMARIMLGLVTLTIGAVVLITTPTLSVPLTLLVWILIVAASINLGITLSPARARLARRVRELDSLKAVGQAVANSLKLAEVLEAIYSQVVRLMDARCFYIALYHEAEQAISFPLAYENGAPTQYISRPCGDGLAEYVIRSGSPLLLQNDVPGFVQHLGQNPRDLLVKAWLGVPIVMNERVLGVMAVQNMDQPNVYDESQRDILMAIATQAATAIRNSQMYTEELALQQMRDDLTDTLVHDLRSPLGSMLGSLYVLEEIIDPADVAACKALAISIRSARRLLNMINSLLDSSKLRTGHTQLDLQPALLGPIVNDVLEYLTPLAQENRIHISHQLPADLPLVLVDADKISRVFINLIDNALKFAPAGGQITLLAERWKEEDHQKYVRCAVRDNGPGIPPEFRQRIFDRFIQITDQVGRRRGSGLGLNFCQLAVEAHGGKIWVEDAPDGGSEFSFTLPIASNGVD